MGAFESVNTHPHGVAVVRAVVVAKRVLGMSGDRRSSQLGVGGARAACILHILQCLEVSVERWGTPGSEQAGNALWGFQAAAPLLYLGRGVLLPRNSAVLRGENRKQPQMKETPASFQGGLASVTLFTCTHCHPRTPNLFTEEPFKGTVPRGTYWVWARMVSLDRRSKLEKQSPNRPFPRPIFP